MVSDANSVRLFRFISRYLQVTTNFFPELNYYIAARCHEIAL